MDLSLSNVINISVAQTPSGLGAYNTSNLAVFTHEDPLAVWATAFRRYLSPQDVATDFGTASRTYALANIIFSQTPNVLIGGGELVIIPLLKTIAGVTEVQKLTASSVPTAGNFQLGYNGNFTADIAFGATAADIQTALRLLTGLSSITVSGDWSLGFTVTFAGITGDALLLVVRHNSLQNTSGYNVVIVPSVITPGVAPQAQETIGDAITRTAGLVQYFGVLATSEILDADILAAATIVQPLKKMAFFGKRLAADVAVGGISAQITAAKKDHTRILPYLDQATTDEACVLYAAAYASRLLSVNFSGSNTTISMHLKQLVGVAADASMTQTILGDCKLYGADPYPSFETVAGVFSTGANSFVDQVYNRLWLVGALEVAGFNYYATTNTKIPQTEQGMDGLKSEYRKVLERAVNNAYAAPGSWTSPTTFGNQEDFLRNISERGYYIFSSPIASQSASDRVDRKSPLVQMALKEAGAQHSGTVIVNINP